MVIEGDLMFFNTEIDVNLIGQILGIFLSVVGFFVYFSKTRRGILGAKLTMDIGYAIQQAMVGAYTGALINGISIFREIVFYHRDKKKWAKPIFWLLFFIVITGLSPVLTWAGPISLLPAAGSIAAVIAFYCRDPHHTRLIGLVSLTLWLIYCIVIPNYGVLLTTAIQLISAILGLIRDYREKKRKSQKEVV